MVTEYHSIWRSLAGHKGPLLAPQDPRLKVPRERKIRDYSARVLRNINTNQMVLSSFAVPYQTRWRFARGQWGRVIAGKTTRTWHWPH